MRAFGLPERQILEIVLYHLPTGSQIIIDAQGQELRRAICDPASKRALVEVLETPELKARALELAE